ncbi:MAG: hypothetical protein ACJ72D_29485 [Marmoricola sp.]
MQTRESEPEWGEEPTLIQPEDFLPHDRFPSDARRMGFDRYSGGEAAILAFASNLDSSKRSHRLFASVLLVIVVGSFVVTIWGQMH